MVGIPSQDKQIEVTHACAIRIPRDGLDNVRILMHLPRVSAVVPPAEEHSSSCVSQVVVLIVDEVHCIAMWYVSSQV